MIARRPLFLVFILLAVFSWTHEIYGNASVTVPVVEVETETFNHKIQDIFLSYDNETILLLDDGSSWIVKDSVEAEQRDYLIGTPVSLMPTAGENGWDRFIVHQRRDTEIIDVQNHNYSRYGCHTVADINGNEFTVFLNNSGQTKTFYVSEDSVETVSMWSEGDPVIIGGVWFDGFDHQQRGVPACTSFTVYNYRYQEFVFTHLP